MRRSLFYSVSFQMLFCWREAAYTFRVLCKQPLVSALAVPSVAFGIVRTSYSSA